MIHDQFTNLGLTKAERYRLRHPNRVNEAHLKWREKNRKRFRSYQKANYIKKKQEMLLPEGARLLSKISIEPMYATKGMNYELY